MRPFRTPAIEFIPDTNESMVDVDIHWESQSVAMQESQVRDPEQQHQQKKNTRDAFTIDGQSMIPIEGFLLVHCWLFGLRRSGIEWHTDRAEMGSR